MKKLTKSKNNIVIAGVLGGIAEYLNIDATLLRVVYVLLSFASFGTTLVLYFVLCVIIPRGSAEKREYTRNNPYYQANARKDVTQSVSRPNEDDWSDF